MDIHFQHLKTTCATCSDELIRLVRSDVDDRVICPSCFAVGDYDRVQKGAGLSTGVLVDEQTKRDVRELAAKRRVLA